MGLKADYPESPVTITTTADVFSGLSGVTRVAGGEMCGGDYLM